MEEDNKGGEEVESGSDEASGAENKRYAVGKIIEWGYGPKFLNFSFSISIALFFVNFSIFWNSRSTQDAGR